MISSHLLWRDVKRTSRVSTLARSSSESMGLLKRRHRKKKQGSAGCQAFRPWKALTLGVGSPKDDDEECTWNLHCRWGATQWQENRPNALVAVLEDDEYLQTENCLEFWLFSAYTVCWVRISGNLHRQVAAYERERLIKSQRMRRMFWVKSWVITIRPAPKNWNMREAYGSFKFKQKFEMRRELSK